MKLRLFTTTTLSSILSLMLLPVLCDAQEKESSIIPSSTQWGIQTNMAYDVLSFVNLGYTTSIGQHWGFTAEFICPWWDAPDHHKTAQMLNLGLEGRYYWRGWRDSKSQLAGPYCGLHVNGGIYDICYKGKGAQGDYFVMPGAVLGYTIPVEDSWRLNLALGVGAMYTPYEHYHVLNKPHFGDYKVSHYTGKYTYVGPTKVELTVVWLISDKLKK